MHSFVMFVFEHLGVHVACLYAPCVGMGCSNPRSIQMKTSVSEANLEEGKVRVQQEHISATKTTAMEPL